jgi:hypothetical protein
MRGWTIKGTEAGCVHTNFTEYELEKFISVEPDLLGIGSDRAFRNSPEDRFDWF